MAEANWSDWYDFEGYEIGFNTPSDKGGVYCIGNLEKAPVYIGRTESLLERLKQHERGHSDQSACIRARGGMYFRFCVIEDPEERETFEGVLLHLAPTPCNS